MTELIFEVRDAQEGGFHARALGKPIFTQAETWDELRENVLEAVEVFFDTTDELPKLVQLHYVRDEILAINAA
jgi:predicted RNase H-like HicB family nuclease